MQIHSLDSVLAASLVCTSPSSAAYYKHKLRQKQSEAKLVQKRASSWLCNLNLFLKCWADIKVQAAELDIHNALITIALRAIQQQKQHWDNQLSLAAQHMGTQDLIERPLSPDPGSPN